MDVIFGNWKLWSQFVNCVWIIYHLKTSLFLSGDDNYSFLTFGSCERKLSELNWPEFMSTGQNLRRRKLFRLKIVIWWKKYYKIQYFLIKFGRWWLAIYAGLKTIQIYCPLIKLSSGCYILFLSQSVRILNYTENIKI